MQWIPVCQQSSTNNSLILVCQQSSMNKSLILVCHQSSLNNSLTLFLCVMQWIPVWQQSSTNNALTLLRAKTSPKTSKPTTCTAKGKFKLDRRDKRTQLPKPKLKPCGRARTWRSRTPLSPLPARSSTQARLKSAPCKSFSSEVNKRQ